MASAAAADPGEELPRPMQSHVDDAWFDRPEQQQGNDVGWVMPKVAQVSFVHTRCGEDE